MREIKFRAWDKRDKKFIKNKKGEIEIFTLHTIGPLTEAYSYEEIEFPESTGRHDKNGKEIYEGDIVRTKFQKKSIVIWDESESCFATNTIDDVLKEEYMYDLNDVEEVIGNIYENPELIKEEKDE